MEANVLCKPPKNTYTYRDGIQAIFVCVIMVDYKPLFFCVIIFFTFLTKPAYITTNIILYRVHTTVFSDPWVVQFLATRWIYPSDSPMRFSDISTLKKKNVRWNNKRYGTPVKSQRSNSFESSAFMWSHHCETPRKVGECYHLNVPRPTSLQSLYVALSESAQLYQSAVV